MPGRPPPRVPRETSPAGFAVDDLAAGKTGQSPRRPRSADHGRTPPAGFHVKQLRGTPPRPAPKESSQNTSAGFHVTQLEDTPTAGADGTQLTAATPFHVKHPVEHADRCRQTAHDCTWPSPFHVKQPTEKPRPASADPRLRRDPAGQVPRETTPVEPRPGSADLSPALRRRSGST